MSVVGLVDACRNCLHRLLIEDKLNINYLDVGEIVRDISEGAVDLKGFAPLDNDEHAKKINDTPIQKEVCESDHHQSLQDQENGKGQTLSTEEEEEMAETMSKDTLDDPKLKKNAPKPPRQGGTTTTENTTPAPGVTFFSYNLLLCEGLQCV